MNSGTFEETSCFALLNALSWVLDPASWVSIRTVYHQAQVWTEGCQTTMLLKCRSVALFCGGGICITAATLWGSRLIPWSKITVSMNLSSLNMNCIEPDVLLVTAFHQSSESSVVVFLSLFKVVSFYINKDIICNACDAFWVFLGNCQPHLELFRGAGNTKGNIKLSVSAIWCVHGHQGECRESLFLLPLEGRIFLYLIYEAVYLG